jgi:hypothetical protein
MCSKNDPKINRNYNYLYCITNTINGMVYIGVHRTDNLDDGYMGSGTVLKRAQKKYGIENFKKEILEFFDEYLSALAKERELVTLEFIESNGNYNIREGGHGNCRWSSKMIKQLSKQMKKRFENPEFMRVMRERCYDNPDRNKKLGNGVRRWIKNNPQKHMERMNKINKNPEKISKMAEKHRGMKRSEIAKKNMRDAQAKLRKNNKKYCDALSGRGKKYIHNPETSKIMRISSGEPIPLGWVSGFGPRPSRNYVNMNLGSVFAYDPNTKKTKRFKSKELVPVDWILGRPKK